jgi:hypothetical protein
VLVKCPLHSSRTQQAVPAHALRSFTNNRAYAISALNQVFIDETYKLTKFSLHEVDAASKAPYTPVAALSASLRGLTEVDRDLRHLGSG